jgi:methionine synthase II (cobalamin-independent)
MRPMVAVTHAGSLPPPPDLRAMVLAKSAGEAYDAVRFDRRLADAVAETVQQQIAAGIEIDEQDSLVRTIATPTYRGQNIFEQVT